MYHERFKGTHYQAGFHWGTMLLKNNKKINNVPTFTITKEKQNFANACLPIYQKYYPEILEEIKGIADGQKMSYQDLYTFLLSMYCFEFNNHCTCFALRDNEHILFGRNSDFLVELEKLYMNCLYQLNCSYAFNGNTTAFVQIEDGVNEYGLAIGLTFIYPKIKKPGLNAGMLVRYLLEKCSTTQEAIKVLNTLPIASSQTITMIDSQGKMAVVECNPDKTTIIESHNFVVASNHFQTKDMEEYRDPNIDDWRAHERYQVALTALQNNPFSLQLVQNILSGKHGFMCQYNRKQGGDTVWSVIYDVLSKRVYRVEGNPSGKSFKEDQRLPFNY